MVEKRKKKDLLDRWLEDNTAYFCPIEEEEICVINVRPREEPKPMTYEESLEKFRGSFFGGRMS